MQCLYKHAINKRLLSSKWVFRCWHLDKPIRSLCCWKCQILLPIRHWGCSWSRQRSTPRMEGRFSPQLSLYVRWICAILLWYAKLKSCCFVWFSDTIAVCSSGRSSAVSHQLSFCKFTSCKVTSSYSQSLIRLELNLCRPPLQAFRRGHPIRYCNWWDEKHDPVVSR